MITAGASRVASGLLCLHAIAITPASPMKLVRSSIFIVCGLPCVTVRSAPAIVFSGPAQRSLMLWPARSPSRLATLSIESSDSFVASAAVSIATGWSEPVPGREFHPLKSSAFHGALLRQLCKARLSCGIQSRTVVASRTAYERMLKRRVSPRSPRLGKDHPQGRHRVSTIVFEDGCRARYAQVSDVCATTTFFASSICEIGMLGSAGAHTRIVNVPGAPAVHCARPFWLIVGPACPPVR